MKTLPMKKTLVVIGLAALAALSFGLVLAQGPGAGSPPGDCPHGFDGPGFHHGPGPLGFGPRMMRALDLTDAQRDQIHQILESHRDQNADLREQMKAFHEQMRSLWSADQPDKDAILAQWAEGQSLRAQMFEKTVDVRLAVRAVLTPEQLTKLQQMREKMGERFDGEGPCGGMGGPGHHKGHRGHRGMGGGPNARF